MDSSEFCFHEMYPGNRSAAETSVLVTRDLIRYLEGFDMSQQKDLIIGFLLHFLAADCPENRRKFRDRLVNFVEFLGDEVFEDSMDVCSFIMERFSRTQGPGPLIPEKD